MRIAAGPPANREPRRVLLGLVLLAAVLAGCDRQRESLDARFAQADELIADGRLRRATQVLRATAADHPTSAPAYVRLGDVRARRGRLRAAAVAWRRALRLAPDDAGVRRRLAVALAELGHGRKALAVLDALEAGTVDRDAELLAHRGRAFDLVERREAARRDYEAALALDPGRADASVWLGGLLVRQGQAAQAVTLLETALRTNPVGPAALDALGSAYAAVGRPERGHDLLRRALATTGGAEPMRRARAAELARLADAIPRSKPPAQAPNVVLVVIDTLRADHVGAYGHTRPTTPRLDRLAAEGILFERAVSQAPWTAASVASLFTGLYPSVHGLDGGIEWDESRTTGGGLPFVAQRTLAPGQPTLATVLRSRGYRTAGFVSNVYLNAVFGFADGFDVYADDHDDYSADVWRRKRRGEQTNALVAEWLAGAPPEPFFLLVHYNDPHWPYDPPAGYGASWTAGYGGRLTPANTGLVVESEGEPIRDLSAEDVAYLKALYDGEIAYADACLGALLDRLAAQPFARPLLTIVTADHGEEFLEHGSASHGYTLYEEQLHVPLVVHLPGRLSPRRVAALVQLVDVAPTVLELIGLESGVMPGQGRSVVPLVTGATEQGEQAAFSEATLRLPLAALRTADDVKLITRVSDRPPQLFDLRHDPGERRDLATLEPGVVTELRARLGQWRDGNRGLRAALGLAGAGPRLALDAATRQRLEALGYLPAPPR